jgi:putative heme iron utilization protein
MNNAIEARQMLRAHRYGALSTLSKKFEGFPFGSITPYLTDHDGSLLILISGLAEHTKNILADPRISLITHDQRDAQIQTQGRITLLGNAQLVTNRDEAGERYLRYFPEAESYFQMHDFAFYRIHPIAIRRTSLPAHRARARRHRAYEYRPSGHHAPLLQIRTPTRRTGREDVRHRLRWFRYAY